MSKYLVVFYSYTGTSRRVAQTLCQQQSWERVEIRDRDVRAGWSGTLRCVLDSVFSREPAINMPSKDMRSYDAVVLVSPIWAYRLAGPMRTFVAQHRQALPDVAVISVMGSRGAPNAEAEIGELLGRSPLMSTSFTSDEVADGSFASRLEMFGKALRQAKDGTASLRPAMRAGAGA